MKFHPTYLASFSPDKGGAIHEQYVTPGPYIAAHCIARGGWVTASGELVYGFAGSMWWYRAEDFRSLCSGAADEMYHQIASLIPTSLGPSEQPSTGCPFPVDPTTGPAPAGGDITSSTSVALSTPSLVQTPAADTASSPATDVDLEAVGRALDAKDALLRRALEHLRTAKLTGERAPYKLELVGLRLGEVCATIVAIEVELEIVDPLGRT